MYQQETLASRFSPLLKDLNPQQRTAVTRPFNSHCLVLAGAGCGKTSVLTRRIAFCAQTYCDQSRILALTFTRKAAEEMKHRLMSLPGINSNYPLPMVTTFHGFGRHVLCDTVYKVHNFRRCGYETLPQLLTSSERLQILSQITTREERRSLGMSITDCDDLVAQWAVAPKKLDALSTSHRDTIIRWHTQLAQVKKERGVWDFSDMLQDVRTLFTDFPEIPLHYANRFDYILVDEFQDTNPLQIALLHYLLPDKNHLFAVGDDDQAIYGFRGADVDTVHKFCEYFPGAEIVKLEMNYRSTPAILASANRIFASKPLPFRKTLSSGRYQSGVGNEFGLKPQKKYFRDSKSLVSWIVETGRLIAGRSAVPFQEMAVLCRLNETIDYIKKEMADVVPKGDVLPQFLTVHGSKGLEFPVVFLCDLEESMFPHYKIDRTRRIHSWGDVLKSLLRPRQKEISNYDFDEEQRLFYVGVTRAEKELYLLSIREKKVHGRTIVLAPSRFLKLL